MIKKNILIVTESFEVGGLETHIIGEIRALKQLNYDVYLAIGEKYQEEMLPKELCTEILTGLRLSTRTSPLDLMHVVEQLTTIIRTKNIEWIHTHPFLAFLPAFIASQKCRIKFALTLHGPSSINFSYGPIYDFLLKSIVLPYSTLVSCVSPEVYLMANRYCTNGNCYMFTNTIEPVAVTEQNNTEHLLRKWAVISRLDEQKVNGLKHLLKIANDLSVGSIDIIGDGAAKEELINWCSINNILDGSIKFMGVKENASTLLKEYDVVAGMGRVILEAINAEKPAILTGYDGVKGYITPDLFLKTAFWNFSGRGVINIDAETLKGQLATATSDDILTLKQIVQENYNSIENWNKFQLQMTALAYAECEYIEDIYQSILYRTDYEEGYLSDNVILFTLKQLFRGKQWYDTHAAQFLKNGEIDILLNNISYKLDSCLSKVEDFQPVNKVPSESITFKIDDEFHMLLKEQLNSLQSVINELFLQNKSLISLATEKNKLDDLYVNQTQLTETCRELHKLQIRFFEENKNLKEQQRSMEETIAQLKQENKSMKLALKRNAMKLQDLTKQEDHKILLIAELENELNWYKNNFKDSNIFKLFQLKLKGKTYK